MASTPQVYDTVWNGQGKNPKGDQKNSAWDPSAPKPQPKPVPLDRTDSDIEKSQANPGKTPIETELEQIQQHNNVAANTLCQKNRKRKQSSMELPFDPTIEEGQTVTLQGFAANFDGKWLITEVNYQFSGKSGSRFTIELTQCLAPVSKGAGAGATGATAGASAGAGAAAHQISVPQQPTDQLVYSGGINSITPYPKNAENLDVIPNETAPTWINAHGALNSDQQNLNTDHTGPTG